MGDWYNSTVYWASAEWVVIEKTHGVDFYNIHNFIDYWGENSSLSLADKPELRLMLGAGKGES